MSHVLFLFVLLSALPLLTTSLQCYTCDGPFTLNYTVTSDTVPKFTNCRLVNATKCIITVFWLQKPVRTIIKLNYMTTPIMNDTLRDSIFVIALLTLSPDDKTPLVSRDLDFGCVSWEKCSDEMNLKQILRSVVIEDKFIPEFVPLMNVVQPFTNKSVAACYEYTNTTDDCSKTSLDTCQRCQISISKWSLPNKEICATCPRDPANSNSVVRESLFDLNNRTSLIDRAQIKCQLPGCNSIHNGNEVYRASNISFNFGEFFKNRQTIFCNSMCNTFIFPLKSISLILCRRN